MIANESSKKGFEYPIYIYMYFVVTLKEKNLNMILKLQYFYRVWDIFGILHADFVIRWSDHDTYFRFPFQSYLGHINNMFLIVRKVKTWILN